MGVEAIVGWARADFASWAIKPPIPAYPIYWFCRSMVVLLTKIAAKLWIVQADLQPIHHKPDRLLVCGCDNRISTVCTTGWRWVKGLRYTLPLRWNALI